jgi:hypothetical protein
MARTSIRLIGRSELQSTDGLDKHMLSNLKEGKVEIPDNCYTDSLAFCHASGGAASSVVTRLGLSLIAIYDCSTKYLRNIKRHNKIIYLLPFSARERRTMVTMTPLNLWQWTDARTISFAWKVERRHLLRYLSPWMHYRRLL